MPEFKLDFFPENIANSYAIKAVANGEATPEQQRRAFECIVLEISRKNFMSFDPESPRNSDFNEGRRFVGRALTMICEADLKKHAEADKRLQSRLQSPKKGKSDGRRK